MIPLAQSAKMNYAAPTYQRINQRGGSMSTTRLASIDQERGTTPTWKVRLAFEGEDSNYISAGSWNATGGPRGLLIDAPSHGMLVSVPTADALRDIALALNEAADDIEAMS